MYVPSKELIVYSFNLRENKMADDPFSLLLFSLFPANLFFSLFHHHHHQAMVWPFNRNNNQIRSESSGKLLDSRQNSSVIDETVMPPHSSNKPQAQQQEQEEEESDEFVGQYKYAPQRRDEEAPMDLGDLQDVFSFSFMKGRPVLNFLLAILWSVGLPILIYNILKPHIGQVLAMIVASAPPLAIVVV